MMNRFELHPASLRVLAPLLALLTLLLLVSCGTKAGDETTAPAFETTDGTTAEASGKNYAEKVYNYLKNTVGSLRRTLTP